MWLSLPLISRISSLPSSTLTRHRKIPFGMCSSQMYALAPLQHQLIYQPTISRTTMLKERNENSTSLMAGWPLITRLWWRSAK
nr:hypothetical protein Iba_chr11fCG7640 [Ipomoea batatas]